MMWRFENTGLHNGFYNMEHDESLASALFTGEGAETVRVYGWSPPALSLGWNQSLDELDLEKIYADGIHVVRRPTGGRAILHSDELTYSVVMKSKGRNISAVYDEISRALVSGLKKIDIPVSIEKSQPHFPSLYRNSSAAACFASAARYEIKVGGKKLVGSAQRRYPGSDGSEIVLQHGSILLGNNHRRIVDFLKLSAEEKTVLKRELEEKTTDCSAVLGRKVSFDELAEVVERGFEEAWKIAFEQQTVSAQFD